jgi:HAD superfamily hydrolase (TIGR01490 family)
VRAFTSDAQIAATLEQMTSDLLKGNHVNDDITGMEILDGAVVAGYAAASPELDAALSVPADPIGAAFFDVDNTMLRGASLYWFARGMAARDYFTARDMARFAWSQLKFRVLATEVAGDMSHARSAALSFVKGMPVKKLETLSEEIFDELMAERIWSGTLALAQLHLAAGQRVWLVTAAPIELGRVIAERLGLTGALGTIAETEDGVYTGRLVGDLLHGPAKAEAIRELAEAHGLDLHSCTAYSDSINDVPMLSAVGHAVAVNPDAALRREARRRHWEVRDFRTARKAVKIAVPAALGLGAAVGAAAATAAIRRRSR